MRLEYRHHATTVCIHHVPGRGQHSAYFGGVMGVVVEDAYASHSATELETTVYSGKTLDTLDDARDRRPQAHTRDHRGNRIERHVFTGNGQDDGPLLHIAVDIGEPHLRDATAGPALPIEQLDGESHTTGQVRLGTFAVSEHGHPTLGHPRSHPAGQRSRAGIVQAHDQSATGVDPVGEVIEHLHVGLGGPEEIEVVGLNVGHDRDVRAVLEQRAVALVGFGDEHVARAVIRVGTGLVELASDGERRLEAAVLQRDNGHRSGGRLSVGARDEQVAMTFHERRQHRRPQQHRDIQFTRGDEFGICLRDRREGRDDHGGPTLEQFECRAVVTDLYLGAASPEIDDGA